VLVIERHNSFQGSDEGVHKKATTFDTVWPGPIGNAPAVIGRASNHSCTVIPAVVGGYPSEEKVNWILAITRKSFEEATSLATMDCLSLVSNMLIKNSLQG